MKVKFDDSGFKKLKKQMEEFKKEVENTKVFANSEEEMQGAVQEELQKLAKKHFKNN